MSGSPPRFHWIFPLTLNYYLRKSCRGAQISWSSFPRSSSGNPCRPGNPAAPPGCPLGNCGHDEMQIWSLGCGPRPALNYYLRKSWRGAQISWSSFPRSSSGNPCRPGNPAAPPGCPLGNCGHDEMQIWSLGCGPRPALSLSKGAKTVFQHPGRASGAPAVGTTVCSSRSGPLSDFRPCVGPANNEVPLLPRPGEPGHRFPAHQGRRQSSAAGASAFTASDASPLTSGSRKCCRWW